MSGMLNRKRFIVIVGAVGALSVAGIAFAYFSATGTGTGNAQVGTGSAVTITATITPGTGGLVPGGNAATVGLSVNNPGSGNQYVGTVSLSSLKAYSDAAHTTDITGTGAGKCDAANFSMTAVVENQNVPAGNTTLAHNGSLVFADSGTNQDGCKSAYLVASFTSN